MLIGFLRKRPLTFEPLIRAHHARENLGLRFLGIGDFALHRVELGLQRLYASLQHADRWRVGPHVMLHGG